jgi:phosphoglycerate dehydrogenase-like enzyme
VTTIVFWSNWPSTPQGGITHALPVDRVIAIADEADLPRARDAEIAFCGLREDRVRKVLDAAPNLRWYHTPSAGVDRLGEVEAFRERGFIRTNNSGSYDIQIAEHVLSFVFGAAKRLHLYRDQQARREWKDQEHHELRGETMVVFGAGSIGGEVVRLAAAVGLRVIAVRRSGGAVPGAARVVTPDRLADVAAEADYLVVAAPLTSATRGAISRELVVIRDPAPSITSWST